MILFWASKPAIAGETHPSPGGISNSRSRIAKVPKLVAAMQQFGHIVLAVVFPSSVVFNSSGFCNSPKASEASKKTLNLPFLFLSGVLGFRRFRTLSICLALYGSRLWVHGSRHRS
jgi:hypothetical protein